MRTSLYRIIMEFSSFQRPERAQLFPHVRIRIQERSLATAGEVPLHSALVPRVQSAADAVAVEKQEEQIHV